MYAVCASISEVGRTVVTIRPEDREVIGKAGYGHALVRLQPAPFPPIGEVDPVDATHRVGRQVVELITVKPVAKISSSSSCSAPWDV
jgi:hypothetical protein